MSVNVTYPMQQPTVAQTRPTRIARNGRVVAVSEGCVSTKVRLIDAPRRKAMRWHPTCSSLLHHREQARTAAVHVLQQTVTAADTAAAAAAAAAAAVVVAPVVMAVVAEARAPLPRAGGGVCRCKRVRASAVLVRCCVKYRHQLHWPSFPRRRFVCGGGWKGVCV